MLSSPEMGEEERVEGEERRRKKRRTERRGGGGRVIKQSKLQELEDENWRVRTGG